MLRVIKGLKVSVKKEINKKRNLAGDNVLKKLVKNYFGHAGNL